MPHAAALLGRVVRRHARPLRGPAGISREYACFFDKWRAGVVERSADSTLPLDAKLLPNGDVAWLHFNPGPSPPGAEDKPVFLMEIQPDHSI